MSTKTGIEWTEVTWNPIVGCSIASDGCTNCYAAREAAGRLAHTPLYAGLAVKAPGEPAEFTGEVRFVEKRLTDPLRWQKPRKVFVNSMSDLFHPKVTTQQIAQIFAVMSLAPIHEFQILTKRSNRMSRLLRLDEFWELVLDKAFEIGPDRDQVWARGVSPTMPREQVFLPNVWLGVSVEDASWNLRIDHLKMLPAAVRWVSFEPLIGPPSSVDSPLDLNGIDWSVIGAESGPGARPMSMLWAREIMAYSRRAGAAVFVKQLSSGGPRPLKRLESFPLDLAVREYPEPRS